MRNKVLWVVLVICVFGAGSLSAKESPEAFFKRLRATTLENLPREFSAVLTGDSINKKIKSIPANSWKKKNVAPVVKLKYTKKDAISIKVENVDELYEDLFAQYVRLFTLGPILTSISDEMLMERYDFEKKYSNSGLVTLRIKLKQAQNSFLAYVNPSTMQILRIDYFMGQEILSSTLIKYRKKIRRNKPYFVPNVFMVKSFKPKTGRPEAFKLEQILIP